MGRGHRDTPTDQTCHLGTWEEELAPVENLGLSMTAGIITSIPYDIASDGSYEFLCNVAVNWRERKLPKGWEYLRKRRS